MGLSPYCLQTDSVGIELNWRQPVDGEKVPHILVSEVTHSAWAAEETHGRKEEFYNTNMQRFLRYNTMGMMHKGLDFIQILRGSLFKIHYFLKKKDKAQIVFLKNLCKTYRGIVTKWCHCFSSETKLARQWKSKCKVLWAKQTNKNCVILDFYIQQRNLHKERQD